MSNFDTVFLNMHDNGRFSLIATSEGQQKHQSERFLHYTHAPNISELIKHITSQNNNENSNSCIRLVHGPIPRNFHCQYLRLVRRHPYDVLAGLIPGKLVIEWNLESQAPCRYAINFNNILNKLSHTGKENILQSYVDGARTHYLDFQFRTQLISTNDWAAFFQYWKWTSDILQLNKEQKCIPHQSRCQFDLIASIQVERKK